MWSAKKWNSQVLVNLPITDVPRCTISSAKTLGLNHLQLRDMGMGDRPSDWAPVVHHGMDELLAHNVVNLFCLLSVPLLDSSQKFTFPFLIFTTQNSSYTLHREIQFSMNFTCFNLFLHKNKTMECTSTSDHI
jgi:hypothetical protein